MARRSAGWKRRPTNSSVLVDDFVFGHVLRTGEGRMQKDKVVGSKVAVAFMDYARRQIETGSSPGPPR
jgi:hypothetical protein